jgi:K+-transporting ATPase A subunit
VLLVSQGVVQNFRPYDTAKLVEVQHVPKLGTDGKPVVGADGQPLMDTISDQSIAQGPVASQEAIKMLGTNGGGFFNANSSHPFENPTPFSNYIQLLSIFAIPAGLTYTLGRITKSPQAAEFIPSPGIVETDLADAAQLSSLADETPEGRSIVVLAKERYGLRGRELGTHEAAFVPFTAQTRIRV